MSKSSQLGSSTLEFIFCAPLLLIVMFVAMELNERIDHRVTSTIAAGNAAWLAQPARGISSAGGDAEKLAKADILGIRAGTGAWTLGISAPGELSNNIMSYTNTKRRSDAYAVTIDRTYNATSDQNAQRRAGTRIGSSNADATAASLGTATIAIQSVVRKLTDPQVWALPSLFPTNSIEEQRLSWSVSATGTSNLALQTIEELAKSVGSDVGHDLQNSSTREYRLLSHHTTYLRRDPAYHPNRYESQALFGLILGSGEFNDFIDQCFMKFEIDKRDCGEESGFYTYVARSHGIVSFAKTMIDTATIACIAASLGLGTGSCNITQFAVWGVEAGIDKAVQVVTDKATNAIGSAIQAKIDEALSAIDAQIETMIDDALVGIKKNIDDAVEKSLKVPESGS